MTTDHDNLLAAIIANPGDDLPRLVLADWLEENAEEVECGACGGNGGFVMSEDLSDQRLTRCVICKGTGRVSNGFAERAEFIRVQVELAGMESNPLRTPTFVEWFHRKEALRQRERELWVAHCREWFNVGGVTAAKLRHDSSQNNYGKVLAVIERGFPTEVHAPLAVLVGGPCERCQGNGTIERRVYHFEPEGRVVGWDDCDPCEGTGRTPGIAREIAKCQPVTEWVATDKEPVQVMGGWEYHVSDRPDARNAIPWRVAMMNESELCTTFPTRELANAALSRAIGEIAKQGEKA